MELTDPDARAMTSQSHSAYTVGYNVQSAVDTEHHLIVAHEVTNVGVDKGHLGSMAERAQTALDTDAIEVFADRGYFKSEEIAACEDAGIEVYVPRPLTSNARAEGRYDRHDFVYDAKSDTYVCPAGERLTYRMTTEEAGKVLRRYWTNVLRGMRAQEALHAKQATPHCSLGERGGPRARAITARSATRCDDRATLHRRTSIRYHQSLDGRDALLDENIKARRH